MAILFTSIERWESGDLHQQTAEDNTSRVLPSNSNTRTSSYDTTTVQHNHTTTTTTTTTQQQPQNNHTITERSIAGLVARTPRRVLSCKFLFQIFRKIVAFRSGDCYLFSVCMIPTDLLIFSFRLMSMEISCDLFK